MRLFIAIQSSEDQKRELGELQTRLLPKATRRTADHLTWDPKAGQLVAPSGIWRPTSSDQLHLTLQFLGNDINLHQQEEIRQSLMAIGPRHPPFDMTPTCLGAFPSPERANVLWAGMESDALVRLADDIAATLLPLGLANDKPFHPHITLARSKTAQDVRALLTPLAGTPWSPKRWMVGEFYLCDSQPILQGREYVVVERYGLGLKG